MHLDQHRMIQKFIYILLIINKLSEFWRIFRIFLNKFSHVKVPRVFVSHLENFTEPSNWYTVVNEVRVQFPWWVLMYVLNPYWHNFTILYQTNIFMEPVIELIILILRNKVNILTFQFHLLTNECLGRRNWCIANNLHLLHFTIWFSYVEINKGFFILPYVQNVRNLLIDVIVLKANLGDWLLTFCAPILA